MNSLEISLIDPLLILEVLQEIEAEKAEVPAACSCGAAIRQSLNTFLGNPTEPEHATARVHLLCGMLVAANSIFTAHTSALKLLPPHEAAEHSAHFQQHFVREIGKLLTVKPSTLPADETPDYTFPEILPEI